MVRPVYLNITKGVRMVRVHFLLALQFLTIIPVRIETDFSEEEIPRSAGFFPAVGAVQGCLAAGTAFFAIPLLTPEIAGVLSVLALIISNGGFHLDGLADTFDALAVKSSGDRNADRARRLAVMKDSATGAIGVTAITLVLLLKCLLVSNIISCSASVTRYALLFLLPVFSQWAMVPAAYHGTAARKDGLGRLFIENVRARDLVLASVITLLLSFVVAGILRQTPFATGSLLFMLFAVLYLFSFAAVKFCKVRFGGITGDSLGAISEIAEIIFLMVAFIWLRHSI